MNVKLNVCPCCGGTEYDGTFSGYNGAIFGFCKECDAAIVLKSTPEYEKSLDEFAEAQRPSTPTVTCPYCQSTDTKKISGTSRWVSTGLFGLASSKVGKQWHCRKCGSDF